MYPLQTFIGVLLTLLFVKTDFAQPPHYKKITATRTNITNSYSPDPIFNYSWKDPKAGDDLEYYELSPVSYLTTDVSSFDMHRFRQGVIVVNGTGSIRFDFGRTNAGWLEFESDDVPDSIQLSISEYNEPAIVNAGALNRIKTLSPVRHGHLYRLELNPQLYEGVRFGWIHVLTHNRRWQIKNLRLIGQVKPVNYKGSFRCNDGELNKIWYTGAYTVKLNLMKDYFGAILMERSDRISWTGDAYPSQAASMVAFGNYDMVKTNLMHTATLDNGIASYALYWVLSLIDYVDYSGDTTFGRAYVANACKKLDTAYKKFDRTTPLGFYGWDERLGAGFENPNNPETHFAYKMLAIHCWQAFGELMAQMGNRETSEKYAGYATEKLREIRTDPNWVDAVGLHAAADAINTGLTTPQENAILYQRNFKSRVNRLSYSPFNEYFIIQSLANIQQYDDALSAIHDCWGGQLKYGGTTFFEVYRPSWNAILEKNGAPVNNQCGYTSLTHPWSAGVTQWLSAEVLGIRPLSPGFTTFEITPQLGSDLTWVKGAMPTPHGPIDLQCNPDSGISIISIPPGTYAQKIRLPLAGTLKKGYLNGREIRLDLDKKSLPDDSAWTFNGLKPGKYVIKIVYGRLFKKHPVNDPPWDYAIKDIQQDSITKGKWKTRFGSHGYSLFNAIDSGKNLQKLPAYVGSVKCLGPADKSLPIPPDPTGILTDTAGSLSRLGAIVTQDPDACKQTMTIDVTITDDAVHRFSLYLLDWDRQDRRSAVELFDLKTKELLAPVQLVDHYQNGKSSCSKAREASG
jgi:alpha-L-rhamnosidase